MPDLIPPSERRELRSVVRQQFKVLRTEVKQREFELIAEAERRILEKFRADDEKVNAINDRLREICIEANRQMSDALRDADLDRGQTSYAQISTAPRVLHKSEDKRQLHNTMTAGIRAQVSEAQMALDRQEADLLRSLAMEALETDQARAFLGRIPQVAELVPTRRLREIEADFDAKATS